MIMILSLAVLLRCSWRELQHIVVANMPSVQQVASVACSSESKRIKGKRGGLFEK